MSRVDRYKAAVALAQAILEEASADDSLLIQQALDDIIDEVRAGRRNQADMAEVTRKTLALLGECGYSVKAPPHLRAVTANEFDDLVKEGT